MPEGERTIYLKTKEEELAGIIPSMENEIVMFTEERIKPVLREQARKLDREGLFPIGRFNYWTEYESDISFRGVKQKLLWIGSSLHDEDSPNSYIYLTPNGEIIEIPKYITSDDYKATIYEPISEIRPLNPIYYLLYVTEALEAIQRRFTSARYDAQHG